MSEFSVRRVVTGFDEAGAEVFTDDGDAPNAVTLGPIGVSEMLWIEGPGLHIADDPDRTTPGFPLEPPAGGSSVRVIRMPGIPARHLAGRHLAAGRRRRPRRPRHARHRHARPDGGARGLGRARSRRRGAHGRRPASTSCSGAPGTGGAPPTNTAGPTSWPCCARSTTARSSGATPAGLKAATAGDSPVRRVITGEPTLDGGAVTAVGGGLLHAHRHLAHRRAAASGGPGRRPRRRLDPRAAGRVAPAFRLVELSPDMPLIDELWHATATIDVDVIVSGRVRLDLPGDRSTELGPGDVVVQRGTNHRWVAAGRRAPADGHRDVHRRDLTAATVSRT